jgi:hypothetical protein
MNPNTHSMSAAGGLNRLAAAVEEVAAEDLDALPDAQAARQELVLRRLIERLEGHWLRELAGVDAAAPPTPTPAPRPSPPPAGCVTAPAWATRRPPPRPGRPRPAPRPLPGTARALAAGELSDLHAAALTRATQELAVGTVAAAEPVLLDAARRLDPPRAAQGGRAPR